MSKTALVECKECRRKRPHYARRMCEACWRNWRARVRWETMPRRKRRARLRQMRERARERRADE